MALAEPQERIDAAAGPPLEALVEKYRGRRFEELLRDPGFTRLGPKGVQALAAEYRRQTKRLRANIEEARSAEGAQQSSSRIRGITAALRAAGARAFTRTRGKAQRRGGEVPHGGA
jgi:predicted DsbA family dithiol-disulfide isomerase